MNVFIVTVDYPVSGYSVTEVIGAAALRDSARGILGAWCIDYIAEHPHLMSVDMPMIKTEEQAIKFLEGEGILTYEILEKPLVP